MKTNVKLLIAIALLATACSTGSKVTSSSYSDDLYYTPGDAQPVAVKPVKEVAKPQQRSTVAMQVEETDQGKVVNNYVVPKSSRKDNNAYYFEEQPAYSDTIVEYADDKEQVTINNYYEGEEMSYATRIRTFYDPYFYDPYWDPYWSFGFGFNYGWGYPYYGYGWGYPYYGYGYGYPYYGWGYPYYGYGWGYPYYGYGWGYPGYGWGYPGYAYPVYYGDVTYGRQNHTGRQGNSNAVRYGANNKNGSLGGASYGRQVNGTNVNSSSTRLRGSSVSGTSGSTRSTVAGAAGTAGSATRLSRTAEDKSISTARQSQGAASSQRIQTGRGETVTNLRRSNNVQGTSAAKPAGTTTRSAASGYTPTYNKPRMNTQPSYNNGASRQTQPYSNGNVQSGRYSRPSGSGTGSSAGTAPRTQSSGSYQRGSAASSSGRSATTSGSGSYNSGSSRSSQSRSYDSGSSGSSGRSYTPSSSYGNSGGGGGTSGGGGGGTSGGGGSRSGGGSGRTR